MAEHLERYILVTNHPLLCKPNYQLVLHDLVSCIYLTTYVDILTYPIYNPLTCTKHHCSKQIQCRSLSSKNLNLVADRDISLCSSLQKMQLPLLKLISFTNYFYTIFMSHLRLKDPSVTSKLLQLWLLSLLSRLQ